MIALRGGRIVLPDRVVDGGTLIVDGTRVADVLTHHRDADETIDVSGRWVVPGFIDVHVHGVEGRDTLDEGWPIAAIAGRLPRYGVTAFCPTTVACSPGELHGLLTSVERARAGAPCGARVLPAHLESNFINPDYRGAQPLTCLRLPPPGPSTVPPSGGGAAIVFPEDPADYTGADILAAIDARTGCTGIVTLAPELPGGLGLVRALVDRGIRVSQGHSGATYEQAMAGFDAGARHATHLFNRMSSLHHRDPGLVGAALEREEVDAELICDGYHVHPTAARLALRLKTSRRVIAITDGTAGSGLPVGSRARLGGRGIGVGERAAFLDDGTLAGSTLTMDRAFAMTIEWFGCSVIEAVRLCSSNPARALDLGSQGHLEAGALADFVLLDDEWRPAETWIDGTRVYSRP